MNSKNNSTRVKAPDSTQPISMRTRSKLLTTTVQLQNSCTKTASAHMTVVGQTSSREAHSLTIQSNRHKIDMRKSINLATWNVLTLAKTGYREAVVLELKRLNIDIAALTEARLIGNGKEMIGNYMLIHSGGTQHHHGVSLVLSPIMARSLKNWEPISERLLRARIAHRHGHLTIIVAYAPINDTSDNDKDNFYTQLETTILAVPPHDQLVVAGDLNAVSGVNRAGFEQVIGPFGSGNPNNNTERLISTCATTGLSIVGSWFRRPDIRRWTWIANTGTALKEIDHMLTRCRKDFTAYRVFRGAECPANTDHRLIIARYSISPLLTKKRFELNRKIDIDILTSNTSLQSDYAIAIQNRFGNLENLPDDVESSWSIIRENITTVASQIIGYKHHNKKPWLSKEAFDLIALKRSAVLRNDHVERNWLKRKFRRKAIEDREKYYDIIASEAEDAIKRHDMKAIYQSIKKISGKNQQDLHTYPTKTNGNICQSEEEALQRWAEYYESALNHPPASPCRDLDNYGINVDENINIKVDAPSLEEVIAAIKKLKNGRSPGSDGISVELLKYSIDTTAKALHLLFCSVWKTGMVPTQWKSGIIVSLYKGKGSRNECSSHRPITLLSVPGKVFAQILLTRIRPLLVESRRPHQSGFTSGRSTMDAILCLRLLSDIHREFNKPLHVAYVDLKSAFDSVDREALWKSLKGIGIPAILLNLIRDLYRDTSSQVRLGSHLSTPIQTKSGVRQGCILAPILFCRAVDWIMERATHNAGVSISGNLFTDADYADDIAALDNDPLRLANTLEHIEKSCSELGLHISWSKTKIQNIGYGSMAQDQEICGHTVEGVEQFTYLGSTQCASLGTRADQLRRIGLAASNMNNLAHVWKQSKLSISTKLRLYMSLIVPVLLYASETWVTTKADIDRLQAFHMRCQRRILNIKWFDRVKNVEIAKQTSIDHIGTLIQRRRHALFGHVVRMTSAAPAHMALKLSREFSAEHGIPNDWRRPRRRPQYSWIGQLRKDTGRPVATSWARATNRTLWRVDAKALTGFAVQ